MAEIAKELGALTIGVVTKPFSFEGQRRKIIAERMTLSATTIPQVTYGLRCDVTDALALRRSLKAGPEGERTAVSFDALVVRAAALALVDLPEANSQWVEGQGIRMLTEVNIAVAVDLDDKGLVIPVIHRADTLDIRGAAAELDRLVAGARAGRLGPDDYAGGTFTITSLASLGVETFNPIIVPPQAAILGVGAIVPTPVFQQDPSDPGWSAIGPLAREDQRPARAARQARRVTGSGERYLPASEAR